MAEEHPSKRGDRAQCPVCRRVLTTRVGRFPKHLSTGGIHDCAMSNVVAIQVDRDRAAAEQQTPATSSFMDWCADTLAELASLDDTDPGNGLVARIEAEADAS